MIVEKDGKNAKRGHVGWEVEAEQIKTEEEGEGIAKKG